MRAEPLELGCELALALDFRRRRRRGLLASLPDSVDDRRDDNRGDEAIGEPVKLRYVETSTRSVWSCLPKRARGTKRPIPGFATTAPPSTITWPRRRTVSTSPTTSVPS